MSILLLYAARCLLFFVFDVDIRGENILFDVGEDIEMTRDELEFPLLSESKYIQKPLSVLPHPLQHDFEWDDSSFYVEVYDLTLTDIGSGVFI